MKPFVHLRLHTAYSLLEGALQIKALPSLCHEYEMPALAITDTDNLFGALEFAETLSQEGVQPIIGCSVSVDHELLGRNSRCALPLLACDEEGYEHLMRLSGSLYQRVARGQRGAIPLEALEGLEGAGKHLICLTGGPEGPVESLLRNSQREHAHTLLQRLKKLFQDRLYLELQRRSGGAAQETVLLSLARDLELPVVATNEPYFTKRENFPAHEVLLCIAAGRRLEEGHDRLITAENYFKSPSEMMELFKDLPEAVENTGEVARRCAFLLKSRAPILPQMGREQEEVATLRAQAIEKLKETLSVMEESQRGLYHERLERELEIIIRMGYAGYFLIVADFIRWAKEQDIPVGPGRGSGVGSLVAYVLGITAIDPLKFNLLFERFLNPDRISLPDFDIDFCQERRDEVIEYVRERHGQEKVAHIITFGTLQARAVIRDVGRVLDVPYGQVDRLCKMIPYNPANPISLEKAVAGDPRLQEAKKEDPQVRRLIDIGMALEGLYRHASTHAAGVVIAGRPLQNLVPLYYDPRSSMPATQFSMKWAEKAGLIKFDFLGLKTLTILRQTCDMLQEEGLKLSPEAIPLEDEKTFQMLGRGETTGIFQLEREAVRDVLRQMRPSRFEDLVALVALNRPGPMDNIPGYLNRRSGKEKVNYPHPRLDSILAETHGVIIYQEQVMQIAQVLAGYSPSEADILRRAMGKKIRSEMAAQKKRFIEGCVAKTVNRAKAEMIFDLLEKFAQYGFNKSHAVAYALIAWQTAYMKCHHPTQFLAASMSQDMQNTDRLNVFRREAARMGIRILPPDVNVSGERFVVSEGKIVYALTAVRHVGRQVAEALVGAREAQGPFKDLGDFAIRSDPNTINRRAVEYLARAGCFDSLHPNRHQICRSADTLCKMSAQHWQERESGQSNLFQDAPDTSSPLPLSPVEDWGHMERLNQEFEALGLYLSGHPLEVWAAEIKAHNILSSDAFYRSGRETGSLAGVITDISHRRSRRGSRLMFLTLSDVDGTYDVMLFEELFKKHESLIKIGEGLAVGVERGGESQRLRALSLRSLQSLGTPTSPRAPPSAPPSPPPSALSSPGVPEKPPRDPPRDRPLRVLLEQRAALEPVKALLGPLAAQEGGEILLLWHTSSRTIKLPGFFRLPPGIEGQLQALPGVRKVEWT